jgi:hypothetical protein
VRRALRAALSGAALLAAAAVGATLLGLLLPMSPGTAGLRLGLLAAAALWAAGAAIARVRREAETFDRFLERIEARFPEVRSWLRNALDLEQRPPAGTSLELADALRDETVRRLGAVPIETLRPPLGVLAPARLGAIALGALLLAAILAPAPTRHAWTTMWRPASAAPPVRLAVEPGSVRIPPGATVVVHARVWGTARPPRLTTEGRANPAAAEAEGEADGGAHLWRFELAQLTGPLRYRVQAEATRSPFYSISLLGEPQPVSFEIEMRSPAYARLPAQRGAATRGDLEGLRGARAVVEVTFDRDLTALAGVSGKTALEFRAMTPRRWRGEVPIRDADSYTLQASAASGRATYRYPIATLADAPPVITVRVPERDVDLPAGQQVPLEVLAQDDIGLTELKLEYRRDAEKPWADVPLARFPGEPREGQVASHWDASPLGLLPGQSATFRFAAYDNNAISGRGVAVSPTFELRFPSLTEMYHALDETHASVQQNLEKVADQARDLQKQLERMERQAPKPGATSSPAYERSQEMKSALERQQQISEQLNKSLGDMQKSLEQSAERDAFREELQRKMQELADLMKQVQSPEFKAALQKMQEALEHMDRHAMEQQLPEWKDRNKEMLANLERTIELLKNLRQEEQIEALANRAEDLAKHQDALNQEHEAPPKSDPKSAESQQKDLADRQQQAADQTQQLAQDTHGLEKQLDSAEEQKEANEAAQEMEETAAPEQQSASKESSQGQRGKAAKSGQNASESLRKSGQQLKRMAEQRQQQRQNVDLAAVRRAAQDLVSIQRATERNLGSSEPPASRANRQTDLSDGTSRVADSLATLAQHTPFLSPELHEALGRAIENLGESGRQLDSGNRQRGEEAGQAGSEALNQAVLELRKSESSMCDKPGSQNGGKMSSREQVGTLGEEQSKLNQETRKAATKLTQQMEMSAGDRQELERIAQEQQRLREAIDQIHKDETRPEEAKLLGRLDQAQQEMKKVEEALRDGNAGEEVEQMQTRILSRLLDAQRSVNRRDYEPQRESRPGEDIERPSPAPLSADLLRESDRLRLDLLKAEADRYPAQYRALIESYLRALNERRR